MVLTGEKEWGRVCVREGGGHRQGEGRSGDLLWIPHPLRPPLPRRRVHFSRSCPLFLFLSYPLISTLPLNDRPSKHHPTLLIAPFSLSLIFDLKLSQGMEREGVRENVIATRPLSKLLEKVKDLKDRDPPPRRIVVVGSGAAGLELSWAFRTLFASLGPSRSSGSSSSSSSGSPLNQKEELEVVLVHRSRESPMADRGQKTVDNVKDKLGGRRIRVLSGREALGIRTSSSSSSSSSHSDHHQDQDRDQAEGDQEREWAMWLRMRGEGGEEEIGSDVVVWATGAGAHEWMGNTGLSLDEEGFVLVSSTLQALDDWRIFAAGDCNSFSPDADPEDESLLLPLSDALDDLPSPLALRLDADHPVPAKPAPAPPATHKARRGLPKAGVYAVRQGPIVAENLLRLCNALLFADRSFSSSAEAPAVPLVPYVPQTTFLALLNTCDGEAISSWYQTSAVGRWVMRLKDYIDRKFMDRFNASLLGPSPVPAASAPK